MEINNEYLSHDFFTDIITFDYTSGERISGDIFISLETVKTNAEHYHFTFDEELRRVMIHGILHLSGLRDKTKRDQTIMRENENQALDLYRNL